MKLFSKIMLGAFLFTSSSAIAQGKSGGNGKNKAVVIKTHTKGAENANEHASANGQIHASDRSILNRPATATTVRMKNNGKYYKSNGNRKYYYKNGKRYTYRIYANRR